MFARLRGRTAPEKTLAEDLKKITDSSLVDIPQEVVALAIEASHNEDDRREIMRHLRECLAEASGKRWRRVWGGLVLAENLVERGSPALLAETAEGHHFDLVQKLSFLENFELSTDERAQKLIRNKAVALRAEVVEQLRACEDVPAEGASRVVKKTVDSPRSNAGSVVTCSTAATPISGNSGSDLSEHGVPLPAARESEPKGQMILHGVVVVGHNDDTTDESSGDESGAPVRHRAVQRRAQGGRQRRRHAGGPPEAGEEGSARAPEQAAAPTPVGAAPTADLLDF